MVATASMDTVIRHLRRAMLRQDDRGRADGQLLASFIEQKVEAAFAALIHRHGPMVFGVCRRVTGNHHDAEDAFQATFLVLARKAASVRPRERLANWLHGVALRTALKAKTLAAKRRGREKQVTEMPEPQAAPHEQWDDLQPLLDQELNGLPENYRLPILLCELEGQRIKEAARQLGWPQGTLAGRLARGRKLLAKRLANRGVVLSAGALSAVVAQQAASAAVPTSLMTSTVQAVSLLSAGQVTVAGMVPAKVALLTEGVLKAMLLSKLKSATVGLLLVVLLIGVAGAFYRTQAAEPPKEERSTRAAGAPTAPVLPNPPIAAARRTYAVSVRVMKAGTDPAQPDDILSLPKLTLANGQVLPSPLHIDDGEPNLLDKVVRDEKIKVGTLFDVRVKRLLGDKVRLVYSFQRNEVEKAGVSEIRVTGKSVQAIQDVELHKPVKVVFQKDDRGADQRWLEITVDELAAPAERVAPAP